jgi:Cd2+/Zn2+-exporting ATPase
LRLIPFLISLGKNTTRTIQINTAAAVAVKFFFLILAITGNSNLALAVFADVGVTLLVVAYSLRLFNFEMTTA